MRYWLTTHWPPPKNKAQNYQPSGVYLPIDRYEKIYPRFNEGDLIFIYQSRSGRSIIERFPDGTEKKHVRVKGREGVIALVKAKTGIIERQEPPEEYTNHTTIWWRYGANTESINSNGFVSRVQLNRILGYKSNFNYRGFGEAKSGTKEITKEQFDEIHKLFVEESNSKVNREMRQHRSVQFGSGGEGELHKALKNLIASSPSEIIGEEGIVLVEKEHSFSTGDRVDVLLRDSHGRCIVVEVEPECEKDNYIGAEQCVKYRALQAFESNVTLAEVRAILFAKKIDRTVRECCDSNGIQCIEPSEADIALVNSH